ncbi:MAG: hypothetical protein JRG92_13830 [Deltaproteobacteria bacterium]|nr:hypothetical protein [Deltaproteobacteria bacterium]
MSKERFEQTLRALIAGELPVKSDYNEFVGHADAVRQLLDVAPDEIRDDLQFLHDLLAGARDAHGAAVLGIFPRLIDPELANVEGRISDYARERCGIALGDGRYEKGELVRESACEAWPGAGSPLTSNRFPYLLDTSASNYFSNRFWHGEGGPPGFIPVPNGGRVVFRGVYPNSRYFAFHPSDFDTNNLATLIDVDLDPDSGSANPFRGPVPDGADRRFTAQFVFTAPPAPQDREPNTAYVGLTKRGEPNQAVFNIYRTTGSELGALPPNNTGVPLPSVSVYDAAGGQTFHCDECDPYPAGSSPPADRTHFAPLPIPDMRGLNWPGKFIVRSNWGLPYDIMASDDLLYLVAPYTNRLGEVFVCRAKALRTPRTPEEPVYTPGMDIRGFTVTTYNFWAGICEDAKVDHEIAHDADGYFTLVVSRKQDRPTNAIADTGVTWLDWGDYLDGQLTFRMLLRHDPLLLKLAEAVESGVPSPAIADYVPRGAHCSRAIFEQGGWRAAFEKGIVAP